MEGIVVGGDGKGKKDEEDSDLHDSEYGFSDDSEQEPMDNNETPRAMVIVDKKPPNNKDEIQVESNYEGSDELNSCSLTDDDELVSNKHKYSKFNEEYNMKDPQFKIGIKFGNFKQFNEAVKNYRIRNMYVMNFKPNSKKYVRNFVREDTLSIFGP